MAVNVFFSPKLARNFTAKSGQEFVDVSVPPKTEGGKWGSFLTTPDRIKTASNGNNYVTFKDDFKIKVQYYDKETKTSKEVTMTPEELKSQYSHEKEEDLER